MNAFEQLIEKIFTNKNYWTYPSYKVNLTKDDKQKIGLPSHPRVEIDILAYDCQKNEVLVIECKSFLDSTGVKKNDFSHFSNIEKDIYKLFNKEKLREVVIARLADQLVQDGLCRTNPKITLALAAGNFKSKDDREDLSNYFKVNDWAFFDDRYIFNKLKDMSATQYDNDVATVVSKIIFRNLKEFNN